MNVRAVPDPDYAIPKHNTLMSIYQKKLARQQLLDQLRADRRRASRAAFSGWRRGPSKVDI